MRLFAAALGMDTCYFDQALVGHHSNMQVSADTGAWEGSARGSCQLNARAGPLSGGAVL
jgi:hypothetical protein